MTNETETPVETLRDGNIKAAIWRNQGQKGVFHGVTFSRTYKDRDGNFHDVRSFSGAQLLRLAHLAQHAYGRTRELDREARAQAEEESNDEE
jgi:hypothetical protein